MFGRRRRPILGAAVLVGTSRMAARHEVQRQAMASSQREMDIQREVEYQRRQEAEEERRIQAAVDEAVKKATAESQTPQPNAAPMVSPPPQQYYTTQSPMPVQPQPYMPAMNAAPNANIPPEQFMQAPSPPAYTARSPSQDERPKSAQGLGATPPVAGANVRYCTSCGNACQVGDKFCGQCGAKQIP